MFCLLAAPAALAQPSFGSATVDDQSFAVGTSTGDIELPAATGGTGALTYSLSSPPAGLSFNATSRILSGTPTTSQLATSYTYTVTDGNNATDELTFKISVAPGGTTLELVPGDGAVTMNWTHATDSGITRWFYRFRGKSGNWTPSYQILDGSARTRVVTGLNNGEEYAFEVWPVVWDADTPADSVGGPTASGSAAPGVAPSKPDSATLTRGDAQIEVSWAAPSDDGGFDITDYDVHYCVATMDCTGTSADWTDANYTGTGTSHIITGLTNGTGYFVRVRATNERGTSGWSTRVRATPATVPDAPDAPTLTVGNAQIEVSWTPPSSGGSDIIGYVAEWTLASDTDFDNTIGSADVTETTHIITSLTNGTAYSVRVAAKNDVGTGTWSDTSEATPATVPSAPNAPTLTSGNTQIEVTWAAPNSGGSDITGYALQWTLASDTGFESTIGSADVTETTHIITSLTNGTAYSVRVAAKNDVGTGTWSPIASETPATVPGAPTGLSATGGNAMITATWTAPGNGGATISAYDLRHILSDASDKDDEHWTITENAWSSGNLTGMIPGLDNGSQYDVQVRAVNSAGNGEWSATATATPATVPDAPDAPTLTFGNAQIEVSWAAPNSGGSDITGYALQWTLASDTDFDNTIGSADVTETAHIITSLTNGTAYSVRVAAKNDVGTGTWSPIASEMPATVPGAPTGLSATGGDAMITATWTAPVSNGGATISAYDLRHILSDASDKGDEHWTITENAWSSGNLTGRISGLDNGSQYDVQVRAVNRAGDSAWSGTSEATPRTMPDAPNAPTLTAGDTLISVSWMAPANTGGSEISAYDLRYILSSEQDKTSDSNWTETLNAWTAGDLTADITGLTNGDEYDVQVRAVNVEGYGAWSVSATAEPFGVPNEPTELALTRVGTDGISATWTAPNDRGSDIIGYIVEYCNEFLEDCRGPANWLDAGDTGTDTSHTISGTLAYSEYLVRVRAENGAGLSDWSEQVSIPGATAPAEPEDVVVAPGNGELHVSWTAPDDGGSAITGYVVQICGLNFCPEPWNDTGHTGLTTSHTVTGLENGLDYAVRVAARNQSGLSGYAVVFSSDLTTPGTPSAPSAPTLTSSDGAIAVTWSAPNANGSNITGYDVNYCQTPSGFSCTESNWLNASDAGTDTAHTIRNLTNGTRHLVRVRAENEHGISGWSPAAAAVVGQATVPNRPGALDLAAGDGTITVQWNAPGSGGSTISGYDVEWTLATDTGFESTIGSVDVTETMHTITGLTNGTKYAVRVRAENSTGTGDWSPTGTTTPGAPASPSAPTLTASDGEIGVEWTAPNDRGNAITGYAVQWTLASDSGFASPISSASVTQTSHTITGLTNGTEYAVRVRAVNGVGTGGWSPADTATPAGPPDAPSDLDLTPGDSEITASWTAPNDRGSAITGYDVQWTLATDLDFDTPDGSADVTETTHTISGLTNGTDYIVRVRAVNDEGESDWTSDSETPGAAPAAPSAPTLTAGNGEIGVEWTAPDDRGNAITGYEVEWTLAADTGFENLVGSADVTETTHAISGLTNGAEYAVRVRAENGVGTGGWSPADTATPAGPPDAPSVLDFTPDDGEITASWTAPNNRGSEITGYDVEWTLAADTGFDNTVGSAEVTDTTHTITGLSNGTAYAVRVRAVNSVGTGGWSDAATVILLGVPDAPSGLLLEPGDGEIVASWTAPDDRGNEITGYDVEWTLATDTAFGNPVGSAAVTDTTHIIAGLNNGTEYAVRVRAVNDEGEGDWATASTTPGAVPAAPDTPTLTPGDGKIAVEWLAPDDRGSAITGYDVQYCDTSTGCDADEAWTDAGHTGTDASHTVSGLTNGIEYSVRVRASNEVGEGGWSVATSTPQAAATIPGAPATPVLTAGDAEISVAWNTPDDNGGSAVTGYAVQWTLATDTGFANPIGRADVTGTTHSITGLMNDTGYSVRVRAMNDVGNGDWSAAATAMPQAPATVPSAPATPVLTAGDAEISVAWNTPDDDGGSAVTGYAVQWTLATDTGFANPIGRADVTGTTHSITGLMNDTGYSVRVRAMNDVGNGDWSAAATAMPQAPATVPSAPATPVLTAGDAEISVAWNTPDDDGGSAVTGYAVQWTAATDTGFADPLGSANITGTSHTIMGLINGTEYAVRVRAVNTIGDGDWSPAASATPEAPTTVPDAPAMPTLTAGDREIAVSWSAPEDDGGSAITGYRVQWTLATDTGFDNAIGSINISGTSYNIAGLTNGTEYAVRVRAQNLVGNGDWSDSAEASPTPEASTTVPDAPAMPTLTAGDREIAVSWSAPEDDGGSAITGYRVQWTLATDTGFDNAIGSINISGTSYNIAGLTNGTEYAVRVRAQNLVGNGDWSDSAEATPMVQNTAPEIAGDDPLMLDVAENTTGNIYSFSALDAEGDDIAWSLGGDDAISFVIDSDTGSLSLASSTMLDYESDTLSFALLVSANDGVGGADTVSVTVQVADVAEPPAAPNTPTVTALSATEITVSWSAPDTAGRPAIEDYDLRYCPTASGCALDSDWALQTADSAFPSTQAILDGLDANSAYQVQVRAGNAEGTGDWSASGMGSTLAAQLLLSKQSVTVTESADGNTASYTVSLGARPGGLVSLSISSDDTSVAGVSPAALNFTADNWNSPRTVTVLGVNDTVNNDGRSTTIRHRASGGGYDTADEAVLAVTLIDDDEVIVSIASAIAPEGDSGASQWTFAVSLNSASGVEVEVDWRTSDDTATAGEDYASASGTVRIPAGQTSAMIMVEVYGDQFGESDEDFLVTLLAGRGAELGEWLARGTILDDDLDTAREEALEGMLAGLGRTLGGDAVDAVTGRLEGALDGGGCGTSSIGWLQRSSLAGAADFNGYQPFTGHQSRQGRTDIRPAAQAGSSEFASGLSGMGIMAETQSGSASMSASAGGYGNQDPMSALLSLLPREYGMRLGASHAANGGEGNDACVGGMGLWARVTTSGFDAGAGGRTLDGQLLTGYVGVDRHFGENTLAGVALSHTASDLDTEVKPGGVFAAQADVSLTSVLPYGRVSFDGGSVWGLFGLGVGEVDMSDTFGQAETDLSMSLAAGGWRREISQLSFGDMRFAVKGDAVASWLTADEVSGHFAETQAEAQRVRVLMEAGLDLSGSDSAVTSLQLDAGGRWDGGSIEGGGGLELDLSLSHYQPEMGLEMSVDGRYTVLHGADEFQDASLSLAMSYDPGERGLGLWLNFAPRWGVAQGGAMSWLRGDPGASMAPGVLSVPMADGLSPYSMSPNLPGDGMMTGLAGDASWRGWGPSAYQAEVGYGWETLNGRELNLYGTMDKGQSRSVLRFGGRMTLTEHLGLGLELTRSEQFGLLTEHAIGLRIGNAGSAPLQTHRE